MDHGLLSPLRDSRTGGKPDWPAMEGRLIEAFASQRTTVSTPAQAREVGWRHWLGAAAAVVIAAAITFYAPPSRNLGPQPQSQATPPVPAAPATRAQPERVEPPPPPRLKSRPRPRAARRPVGISGNPQINEFVLLPGAFALPAFESGRIVRMEVPLTGLPAYGIDLVPDAAAVAIQADFLVGQDGLPRAIRLAPTSVP